jgi:prevent-host-death family protein
MTEVKIVDLKNTLGDVLNRVAYGHERVVILSRGKPKAVIISVQDLERLEDLEDAQSIRDGLAEHERGETIPWEEAEHILDGGNGEIPA